MQRPSERDRASGAGASGAGAGGLGGEGGWRPDDYGAAFADVYDEWYGRVSDADAIAAVVAERCGTGPVLELGVGTGRVARPLRSFGLEVVGLDASGPMLDRCRANGVDPALHLVRADMSHLPFRTRFGAVLIAFNTLFNLPSASRQRALFAEVAAVLAPDGVLVVETMDTAGLATAPARSIGVRSVGAEGLTVVACAVVADDQTVAGQHVEIGPDGVRLRPWVLRWSTADEIDRFAADAGLVGEAGREAEGEAGGDADGIVLTVFRHR
ncbi:MAG: class I SAM-dependent methyltransferase [Acidimicrobiales bacterium]